MTTQAMRTFMLLVETALEEMPIAHWQTVGDFNKSSSFRHPEDRALLTNPKSVEKMHKKFANNRFDFNFFFVNSPEAGRHIEVGRVGTDWLVANMPKTWEIIEPNISPYNINVIFTNNSAAKRYPITPWLVAHRLGHAFARIKGVFVKESPWEDTNRILTEYTQQILQCYNLPATIRSSYGGVNNAPYVRYLFQQLGTMKSARDNNLRQDFEFRYELLAQYLTTGSIKLKHLSNRLMTGYAAYGRPKYAHISNAGDLDYCNGLVDDFAESLNDHMDDLLRRCIGSIFVM